MQQMLAYPYIRGGTEDLKLENKGTAGAISVLHSVSESEQATNIVLKLLAGETLEQVGGDKAASNALKSVKQLIDFYFSYREYSTQLKNALAVVDGIIKQESPNTSVIEQANAVLKPLIESALLYYGAHTILKDHDRHILICGEMFKNHEADSKASASVAGDSKDLTRAVSRLDKFTQFLAERIPNAPQRDTLCKRYTQGLGVVVGIYANMASDSSNHVICTRNSAHVTCIDVNELKQTYSWAIVSDQKYAKKGAPHEVLGNLPGGYATDVLSTEAGIEHAVTFSSNRLLHDLLVHNHIDGIFTDIACTIPGPRYLAAVAEEELNIAIMFPLKLAIYQLEQRKRNGNELPQLALLVQLANEIDAEVQRENLLAIDYLKIRLIYEKRCWDLLNSIDKRHLVINNTAMPGEQWYMLFAMMRHHKLIDTIDIHAYFAKISTDIADDMTNGTKGPIVKNILQRACAKYNSAIAQVFKPDLITTELDRLDNIAMKMGMRAEHNAAHKKCLDDMVANATKLRIAIGQYHLEALTDPLAQRKATALTEILTQLLANSAQYINADGYVLPQNRQQYKSECIRIKKSQNAVLKDPRDKFLRYTLEVVFILFSAVLGFIPAVILEGYRAYKDGMFGFWACRTASNALAVNGRNSFMAVAEFAPATNVEANHTTDRKAETTEGLPLLATAISSQYNSTFSLATK